MTRYLIANKPLVECASASLTVCVCVQVFGFICACSISFLGVCVHCSVFSSFVSFTCTWFPQQYFTVEFFSVFVCKWYLFNLFQLLLLLLLLLVFLYHLCRCHRNCVVRLKRKHTRFAAALDDIFGRFIFPSLLKFAFSWFCTGEVICCWWLSKCLRKKEPDLCIFYSILSIDLLNKEAKQTITNWSKKREKNVHNIDIDIIQFVCVRIAHTHLSIVRLFDCCFLCVFINKITIIFFIALQNRRNSIKIGKLFGINVSFKQPIKFNELKGKNRLKKLDVQSQRVKCVFVCVCVCSWFFSRFGFRFVVYYGAVAAAATAVCISWQ